jgi:hypothetical protein
MNTSRVLAAPILVMPALVLFGLSSCTNIAKFTITQNRPVERSQFTKVVVVPLAAIGRMTDDDLLDGERTVSDFVERVFKSKACQVIRAEHVRHEMNLSASDATINFVPITQKYGPDGVVYVDFRNLESSGGFNNAANGYLQGDIVVHLLDAGRHPLVVCTGYAHAENGTG